MDTLAKRPGAPETLYLGYHGRRLPAAGDLGPGQDEVKPAGELVETRTGEPLLLREIAAGDVAALRRGFSGLSADEVRMRFLHPMTELPEAVARALCDLDPEHAVAFVLIDPPGTAEPEIHAVARAYIDPVTLAAEFALVVQHRIAGQHFGSLLMERLIAACRERGAVEMWGDVFAENGAMLELCDFLGFKRHSVYQEPGIVRVTLDLAGDGPGV